MKKIIFKEQVSEIHFDDVTEKDIIIVKNKGIFIGTITMDDNKDWCCAVVLGANEDYSKKSDAINHFKKDCEFYVL